jgi:hypothetical protein
VVPALLLGDVAIAQHPVLDMVASKVVQKYEGSTCKQFWQEKVAQEGHMRTPHGTVIAALCLGSISIAGAIYMVIEMSTPLGGLISVTRTPLREALALLGQ